MSSNPTEYAAHNYFFVSDSSQSAARSIFPAPLPSILDVFSVALAPSASGLSDEAIFSPSCSPELCGRLHPSWPRFVDYNEYERKSFERSCFQLHTILAATALLRSLKSPASIQQDILAYQSRIDSVKHSTCGCLFRKLRFLPRPTLFLAGLLHLSAYGSIVLGCLRCLARCQKKSSWRVKIICRRAFYSAELSGGKTLFILPKDFGQYVMGK